MANPLPPPIDRFPAPHPHLVEATLAELQTAMDAGTLTAVSLLHQYRDRIAALDRQGPTLRTIIERNPDADAIAAALDAERAQSGPRGPLHGIPVLLKDNIATRDQMQTTAGSLALVEHRPPADATVAARLRQAGAVILGKANMSEWANFRSTHSSSGWSARGGQGRNPYRLGHNPCGSSSGSATAVAANLVPLALGTETDGSIICPASSNGVVGIKPTVGLTSRRLVIPISATQDTVGPFARTVADAAALLAAIAGADPQDGATKGADGRFPTDSTPLLDRDALKGARLGVPRQMLFESDATQQLFEAALADLQEAGAEIIDPVHIPDYAAVRESGAERELLLFEFKQGIAEYLAQLPPPAPRTLEDLIRFNLEHAAQEMPYFGQELFIEAAAKPALGSPAYREAYAGSKMRASRVLHRLLAAHQLDALLLPSAGIAGTTDLILGNRHSGTTTWLAARAGTPIVSVPAGFAYGLPLNLSFLGAAWSEPRLVGLAYAYEQATRHRRPPRFLAALGGG